MTKRNRSDREAEILETFDSSSGGPESQQIDEMLRAMAKSSQAHMRDDTVVVIIAATDRRHGIVTNTTPETTLELLFRAMSSQSNPETMRAMKARLGLNRTEPDA